YLPLLKAINDNDLPGFANGGLAGITSIPSLPRVPQLQRREDRVVWEVRTEDGLDVRIRRVSAETAQPIAASYSQAAMVGAVGETQIRSARRQGRKLGLG
ncbi:hypothetical protein, partial [Roseisolibacter sp. H3M3-2]|uniref:hypothetical protein n=1 Tax=Roseisolibacter sp. H3M3-2 TaxID=3031323 RepID=UPI0023DC7770